MAKWQSKAQIEEQAYQLWRRQVYPQLESAIRAFIESYDENQPIEEDMKTLEQYPVGLLERRLAKYCVWPLVRATNAQISFQSRIVSESIEQLIKPMRDAAAAKRRAEEQAKREALKTRPVVEEGMYRQSSTVGAFVLLPERNRVLICISSEYLPADEDINQFDSGYYEKFAEPTQEEMQTPEYLNAKRTMEINLDYERVMREQIENRRQAELKAIRTEGREPTFFENIFAGTGDN